MMYDCKFRRRWKEGHVNNLALMVTAVMLCVFVLLLALHGENES